MLKGKTAMVTGSNRGIGLAVVKLFAKNHADILACARTQTPEFEKEMQELANEYGISILPVYFDLSDEAAATSAVKQLIKNTARIDILVNNAGVTTVGLFGMTPVAKIKQVFDINFFAQLSITQLVTKKMSRNHSGSVINICSVSGLSNEKGGLAYGSSKAALAYATKTLAVELGANGIRVNAVSPGFIDTDMWKERDEDLRSSLLSKTPLARQGSPEDVAKAVLFLASDDSSYITGRNIIVDGGRI